MTRSRAADVERWLVAATLAGLLLALACLGGIAAPLGHDEAVYATGARSLLDQEAPSSGWSLGRSAGMKVLGVPGVLLGGSDSAMRLVCWAFALVLVLLIWRLGRRSVGGAGAAFAAAIFVGSAGFLRRAPEFLSDVPSACFVLGVLLVFQRELNREKGPSWGLLAAAPLGAAAFWIRYGASLTLFLAGLGLCLLFGPSLWRARWKVAATLLLFLALIAQFFLRAKEQTGSYLGILKNPANSPESGWATFEAYERSFPDLPVGYVGGAVLLLGAVSGAWVAVEVACRRRRDFTSRTMALFWFVAVAHAIIHGIKFHYEPRYLFVDVILLLLLGMGALRPLLASAPRRALRNFALAGAVVLLVYGRVGYRPARSSLDRMDVARDVLVRASHAIRDRADGPCLVISSYIPHLTWYAGCTTRRFPRRYPGPARLRKRLPPGRGYVVWFEHGKRQPPAEEWVEWLRHLRLVEEIPAEGSGIGVGAIYRVR